MKKTKKVKETAPVEVVEVKESKQEIKQAFADYKVKYPELYALKNKDEELERRIKVL